MLKAQLGHLYNRIQKLGSDKIAIAYSGGGDSAALLHMLRDFPTVTHAFIIDHNLRPESPTETQSSADYARSLGYSVQTDVWQHDSPKSGIQVKARAYRYAAMGEMCRRAGITHLLTAHTGDDQAETLLMRQARDTAWRGLAGMRAQSYGPLWPALADVQLVRPLLNVSRQALRDYNQREGLTWIEDPSNENQDFTRVRARQRLNADPDLKLSLLNMQSETKHRLRAERRLFKDWMTRYGELNAQGFFTLSRVPPSELLLHLLRIASGTGGPIDSARRDALCKAMAKPDFKAATLAGAWIIREGHGFLIARDKVAVRGRRGVDGQNLQTVRVKRGEFLIWDGRFRIECLCDEVEVLPAFGHLQNLRERAETKGLFDLPESVRASLPTYRTNNDFIGFGTGEWGALKVSSFASKRLESLWSII